MASGSSLTPGEAPDLAKRVAVALDELDDPVIESVEYHTADPARYPAVAPYLEVIKTACGLVGKKLEVIILTGNPD